MLIHLSTHLFMKHMFLCGPVIAVFPSWMRLKDCICLGSKKATCVHVCVRASNCVVQGAFTLAHFHLDQGVGA